MTSAGAHRFGEPDTPDDVHRLRADLEALRASVGVLTQLLAALDLEPAPGTAAEQPAAWIWTTLTGDEETVARAQLAGWVDQLVDRYGLAEAIPGCWDTHPPILEELSALRAAWFAAYRPGARLDQPVAWHDALDRVLARIRLWNRTGCAASHRAEPAAPRRRTAAGLAGLAPDSQEQEESA